MKLALYWTNIFSKSCILFLFTSYIWKVIYFDFYLSNIFLSNALFFWVICIFQCLYSLQLIYPYIYTIAIHLKSNLCFARIIQVLVRMYYITLCFVLWLSSILYFSRCMHLSLSALYSRVRSTAVLPLSSVLVGMHVTVLIRVLFKWVHVSKFHCITQISKCVRSLKLLAKVKNRLLF